MNLEETRPKLSSWSPIGAIGSMPASSSSRRRGSIRHTAVPKAQVYPLAFLFLAIALNFTACTDYVAEIDDRYGEWETASVTPQSSDSETSVSTGTITDPRDGRIYKTVTIGSQTWMAQNLNYETGNSYCYKDSASYCSKYGRLYTWEAATTACLDGWHLPTEEEFETLFTAVGGQSIAGQKLKFATGWTAYSGITNEDAFAFSALPAGGRDDDGDYDDEGNYALFWSSIENGSNNAYYMSLVYDYGGAFLTTSFKNNGFSVRCLKD